MSYYTRCHGNCFDYTLMMKRVYIRGTILVLVLVGISLFYIGYIQIREQFTLEDFQKHQTTPRLKDTDEIDAYCKILNMTTDGEEGHSVDGFLLRMVHVFIRHGERTPSGPSLENPLENYNCKYDTWFNGNNTKFRLFPENINRLSKAQRKFQNSMLYPNLAKCSFDTLTSLGAYQQLQMGQFLYNTYKKHPRLFNRNTSIMQQMKIVTTRYSRTVQSAIAFIYGFLPDIEKFRFDLRFEEDIHFCHTNVTCLCPHATHLYTCSKRFLRALKDIEMQFSKLVNQCLQIVENKTIFTSQTRMADHCGKSLNTGQCKSARDDYHRSLTNFETRSKTLTWEKLRLSFLKYASIKMMPVLLEIEKSMKLQLHHEYSTRFKLYSGHDVTILPLLHVLGIYDLKGIPPASRVVIELYESNKSMDNRNKGRSFLKFYFNGMDKTTDVIFCQNKTRNGFCSFDLFSDFLTNQIITRFGYTNYSDACFSTVNICKSPTQF